jgi:hypothetical protein
MKGRYLDATHHGLVNSIHSIGQQKKPYVSLSTNPMIINFEKLKRPAFAKEIAWAECCGNMIITALSRIQSFAVCEKEGVFSSRSFVLL